MSFLNRRALLGATVALAGGAAGAQEAAGEPAALAWIGVDAVDDRLHLTAHVHALTALEGQARLTLTRREGGNVMRSAQSAAVALSPDEGAIVARIAVPASAAGQLSAELTLTVDGAVLATAALGSGAR